MDLIYLFVIAIALAMDAFTVAVCKGLVMPKATLVKSTIVGVYFGVFQAVMPLLGYLVGKRFAEYIVKIDHWIAFFLLAAIGINMIYQTLIGEGEEGSDSLKVKDMLVMSVATSIDAMAIGVAFAFLEVNILFATLIIGIVTFILSACGVKIGNYIGCKFKKYAEIAGGITLLLLGIKILLEGLGIL